MLLKEVASSAPLSLWRVRMIHHAASMRMTWCFRCSKEALRRSWISRCFCNALSAVFTRADDGTVDKQSAGRDISVVCPTIGQDTDGILLPPFRQDMHEETCCSL